ncbi:MAG TPA: glycosyltransferase [Acetobacteraceae bacterium]|nr:glycosyltransferase [Acetobacteraceae bacterium]
MTTLAVLSLAIWLYLLLGHGRFWHSEPELAPVRRTAVTPVTIIVPARDEAPSIAQALQSLLAQDYHGAFRVILVDDGSRDGTGAIARGFGDSRLMVVDAKPRPAGWSGKLWAVAQGLEEADTELVLLTDADIIHDQRHLSTLVAQAERNRLDMVSEMVALACNSHAEHALVPAFVFFFQLLYPFAKVNDPLSATAAAAGGTVLIRRRALDRIGGIQAIRGALIDDVALAAAVKRGGRIWLGHTSLAHSIREYPTAGDIWRMVSRTAYVQLRFSPLLLLGTTLGMALTFLLPPLAALFVPGLARWSGWAAWGVMAACYRPTLHRYGRSMLWAPGLPLVAAFYMAATIGSAVNHHVGRGVAWKGRAYA